MENSRANIRQRITSANFLCKPKAVMSPFSNSKMSPFVRRGGDGIGQRSGDDELQGGGSRGADSGRGGEAYAAARGGETAWDRGAPSQAVGSAISSDGPAGLVSGHRGKRPNNAIGEGVRRGVLALVRKRYADFGPTLACEKLVEVHGHRLSAETLRQWMMAEGLWRSKARRAVRVHPRRSRRACVGDLVQIDGSPHDWFEGRGPLCTLIVYVDDATTRLMAAGFFPAETTDAYMETTRRIWRRAAGRWRITRTGTVCSGSTRRARRTS